MKGLFSGLFSIGLIALPVTASDLVRIVKVSEGGGINQMQPIEVKLANGYGVTITFFQSGQKIIKAWLNNPAFVVLDADGCLVGLSAKNCQTSGSSVLHLKRIQDLPINGLPKTNFSLLTLVTHGTKGNGVYVFRIIKANTPGALVYEIMPSSPPVTAEFMQNDQMRELLLRGLEQALSSNNLAIRGQIKAELTPKLLQFRDSLKNGSDILVALEQAQLDIDTLTLLIQLGKEQSNGSKH